MLGICTMGQPSSFWLPSHAEVMNHHFIYAHDRLLGSDVQRLESIFIPCWFIPSIIPKDIETRTQKYRIIQHKLIIKHKVSVHLRMNFLLQLFSSTSCNWTTYIKWSFIWRWMNARDVLIKCIIWNLASVRFETLLVLVQDSCMVCA